MPEARLQRTRENDADRVDDLRGIAIFMQVRALCDQLSDSAEDAFIGAWALAIDAIAERAMTSLRETLR